jgi:HAE1 family hydrophobic/amphiphilic exporter-1
MKIAEICVQRPVFAVMLIAFMVTLGIFSFRSLGVDLYPKVDPATVNVTVYLPGSSPDELISSVVLPLEDAISSVSGIDEMMVRASEGAVSITTTFKLERNIESATQDVREKVSTALKSLPPNVLPPIITKVDPDSYPILTVVVSGPMSRRELTEIADKVVRRGIQTVDGVGQVELTGGQARQIRVLIDAQRLTAHNLTVTQLRDALVKENIEEPGGHMIHGPEQVGLRTLGRIASAEQFGDVIVAYRGGAPVRVRDVGRVEDSAEELRAWAMLGGKDVVSVQITRQAGTNTVQIADEVKRRVELLKRQVPPGVQLQVIGDLSTFIKASVNSLLEHLILGSVLASIVVLLFIRNLRAVLIASVAIPASVISTFTLMKYMDFTLNNMTLLALTLAVGIVIDDAIIVLENIFRYQEEKGVGAMEAAIQGTREIGLAVMATTFSLVIIFLPIAFMTGYARQYVHPFGWTMALSILVSMVVSFTLTPMMSSRLLKVEGNPRHARSRESKFARWLEKTYLGGLQWSLDHRLIIIAVCVAVFLFTFPLYRLVGRDWIPFDDQNELNTSVDFPEGQSLERSITVFKEMAEEVSKLPDVVFVEVYTQGQTYHGHLYINLVDRSQRKRSSAEIGQDVRKVLAPFSNTAISVRLPSVLGGENYAPIRAVIRGPDIDKLAVYGPEDERVAWYAGRRPRFKTKQTGVTGEGGPSARRRPGCAHGGRGFRGPADVLRARRNFYLQRRLRAVFGHHAVDPRTAGQLGGVGPTDGALGQARASAAGEPRDYRARERPDHDFALQPPISGQRPGECGPGISAGRRGGCDPPRNSIAAYAARLYLWIFGTGAHPRRNYLEHDPRRVAGFDLHVHGAGGAV